MRFKYNLSIITRTLAIYTGVLTFALLAYLTAALHAEAASLSLNPATGVYTSGQTFSTRVLVNTSGQSINAADGTLKFNPSELTVVSVSKGSIFNLWTAEPSFSNTAGTISFSGGTPTGYSGSAGTVLTITFRTKGSGSSRVNFASGSVLAADGRGTNVLTNMNGGSYTISAATNQPEPEVIVEYVPPANTPAKPVITSTTHPDPTKWYTQKKAELNWSLPTGVTAVRTLLDNNPSSIPSKVYDTPISQITLNDLEEGEQYFHIQFKNSDGWGKITHYRLAIDSVAPTDLILSLTAGADLANPDQIIKAQYKEDTSKVLRYKVALDGDEPFEYIDETGSSTIELTGLAPGYHTVIVEAFDQAGNSTVGNLSFTILAFDKPVFTDYPTELNESVIPVFKGLTRPGAEVNVKITRNGLGSSEATSNQEYTVTSDDDGVFVVVPEGTFGLGSYTLIAVAVDQFGAQSEPSDAVNFAVQQPGYLKFGTLALSVLSVFVPLFALLLLFAFGVWYFVLALRRTRRRVGQEASEALEILGREFNKLQKEIASHREKLASSRKTKKLTKAESEVLAAIEKSLSESERKTAKEISDIEDVVD